MLRSGDWMHPKLLGIYHYHKPPLTYWLTATAMNLFGINPFAVRFFLVVAFALQVLLIYRISATLFKNAFTPLYAASVYASTPIVLISVRGLTTDAYTMLWTLLAIFSWVKFRSEDRRSYLWIFSLAVGLSCLTKGPVAFAIIIPFVIGTWPMFPTIQKRATDLFLGFLIIIGVGFGWFIFLIIQDIRFLDYFLLHHLVDRIAHAEMFSRREPWYYYLPIIPLISLPWTVVHVFGVRQVSVLPRDKRTFIKVLIWSIGIPLIIYSVSSSKLLLYILPIFAGFSMATGHLLATSDSTKNRAVLIAPVILIYLALLIAPFFITDLVVTNFMIIIALTVLLAAVSLFLSNMSYQVFILSTSTLFATSLILYSSMLFKSNALKVNSTTPIAAFIKERGFANRNILIYNELLPSIAFTLDKMVISVHADNSSLERETQFEVDAAWRKNLIHIRSALPRDFLVLIFQQPYIFIVKRDLPASIKLLVPRNSKKQKLERWTIYYSD